MAGPRPLLTDREAAWFALPDAVQRLSDRRVTKAQLREDEQRWHVTAVDATPRGRQAKHEAISATGAIEIGALERPAAVRERVGDEPRLGGDS